MTWCQNIIHILKWKRAQKYEVEFWKDICFHGYEGHSFEEWKELNRRNKIAIIEKNGKPPEFYNDKTVVEIGCGPRGVIAFLKAKERIGIDPAIWHYQKYYGDLMDKTIRYIPRRAEYIPLPDDYADVIFCWNCLDHTQNPAKVLRETRRILKSSGFMSFQVNLLVDPETRSKKDWILHPWVFNERQITLLLEQAGFKVSYQILEKPNHVHEKYFEAMCT